MTQHKLLRKLGLGHIATSIYLYLVENGENTVLGISRDTGISRTNIYHNIAKLKDLNLVSDGFFNSKKVIIPESPDNLLNLVNDKIKIAKELADLLGRDFYKNKKKVEIKFFNGVNGIKKCLNNILNSGDSDIFHVVNESIFAQFFSKKYVNFFQKDINIKILMPYYSKSVFLDKYSHYKDRHIIKFMPKDVFFDISIIINNNNVYIFTPFSEGCIICIKNEMVSQSMLSIFNTIWGFSSTV